MSAQTLQQLPLMACKEPFLFPVLSTYHPMVLMEAEHEKRTESLADYQTALALLINVELQEGGLLTATIFYKHSRRLD